MYKTLEDPDIGFSYAITDGTTSFDGDVVIVSDTPKPDRELITLARGKASLGVSLDDRFATVRYVDALAADPAFYTAFEACRLGKRYPVRPVVDMMLDFFFRHYDIDKGQRHYIQGLTPSSPPPSRPAADPRQPRLEMRLGQESR